MLEPSPQACLSFALIMWSLPVAGCVAFGYGEGLDKLPDTGPVSKSDAAPRDGGADVLRDASIDTGPEDAMDAHVGGMDAGDAADANSGGMDAGMDARVLDEASADGSRLDATMDAGELDATMDAGELDAMMDASELDGAPDGDLPDCNADGSCPCPTTGSACAGDLWVTCDEAGLIATVVDCRSRAGRCEVGVCTPDVGCEAVPAEDGTACEDGLFCTDVDRCVSGSCVGGADPCQDTTCAERGCDEETDSCTRNPINEGDSCGEGGLCTTSGYCSNECEIDGSRCSATCPETQQECDLSCEGAPECEAMCTGDQTCNVDCQSSQTCTTNCDSVTTNCNTDCVGTESCNSECLSADCGTHCQDTGSCTTSCGGFWATCPTDCSGSESCQNSCTAGANCDTVCQDGDHCAQTCSSYARCRMDCTGATSCEADCSNRSACSVDCRDAASCNVRCSSTSVCYLQCDPADPECGFEQCWGGSIDCGSGLHVCHGECPEFPIFPRGG